MNIRTLWYLLSAITCGGIAAGARRLGIAQSTMSGAIKELEVEVAGTLFERTLIGLRPTPAAVRLRNYAVWLVTEVEQAFLDLQTGRVAPLESISIFKYGIPSCSAADWATIRGVFSSVARTGARGTFVTSEKSAPESRDKDGILIYYRLMAQDQAQSAKNNFVEDGWRLVFLNDTAKAGRQMSWWDLAQFKLLVPPAARALDDMLRGTAQALEVEVAELDQSGAPYILLDRKDAALLVPSSILPDRFVEGGIQILPVSGLPVVPVLAVEPAGEESLAKLCLAALIKQQLQASLYESGAPLPRIKTLDARVDLHTYRCFHATIETGSTARAAKACFVVQPAISRQIRKLEAALASPLFNRSHSGMTPTPAGQRLHHFIDPVLSDHEVALERLREGPWEVQRRGSVRLGIIPAANEDSLIAEAAADALAGWRAEFTRMPISVAEGYTSVLLRWLRTHLIDLAIIDTTETQSGLWLTPIFREPITLIFARRSTWDTPEETIDGRSLAAGRLVIPSRRFGLRSLFDKAFAEAGTSIAPGMEVDSLAIALQLVRSGKWATVLPPSAVHRHLREGGLKTRLLVNPSIERRICAAQRSRPELPTATAALLAELIRTFHQHIEH